MTRSLTIIAVTLSLVHAGCGDDAIESPTAPTDVTPTIEHFSGSLSRGATRFFSFTASREGSASVMLASVTAAPSGRPLSIPLRLGLGIPRGTGCDLLTSTMAAPSLVPQLAHTLTAGIYCVEVSDVAEVADGIDFAARFTHP